MLPHQRVADHVRFGCFEVDLGTGEVFRKGRRLHVSGQPAQVLVILIERAGQLVTRDELRVLLWPEETFVDFDHGLNNCINRLRDVLGDSAASPEWIETLPKRGYRFIGTLQNAESLSHPNPGIVPPATAMEAPPASTPRRRAIQRTLPRRLAAAAVFGAAILTAGAGLAWHFRNQQQKAPFAEVRAIAVLQFANLSGDSVQDYVVDGVTDELSSDLGRRVPIPVVSSHSVKRNREYPAALPVVARELGVDAVVESSMKRSGNQFDVAVRVVAAQTGTGLWSRSYQVDYSQLQQLASQIAADIAQQFGTFPSNLARRPRTQIVSSEAYEQYLQGQIVWNEGSSEDALRHFQNAIALQPDYAAAYGGMAKSYCRMEYQQVLPPAEVYPPASAAAQKALTLDPNNADAHAALSYLYAQRDWDFERAEQELRIAIADDPASYVGHRWYRYILHQKGRHQEALQQARLSLKSDPASAYARELYGLELEDNGDYPGAIAAFSGALELTPNDGNIWNALAYAYEKTGKLDLAAEAQEKTYRFYGEPDIADRFHQQLAPLGYRRAVDAARREHLLRELARLKKKSVRGGYVSPSAYAFVYAGLHDRENTLRSLEAAYASDSHVMTQLRETDFDFVRSDPRFQKIWDRVPFSH